MLVFVSFPLDSLTAPRLAILQDQAIPIFSFYPSPSPLLLGLQAHPALPIYFCMGAGAPNPGPQAYTASPLTEPSPSFQVLIFIIHS